VTFEKTYHEDLGTKGEDGLYDYAYCYHIYEFYYGNKSKIIARRYIYNQDECSIINVELNGKPVAIGEALIYHDQGIKQAIQILINDGARKINFLEDTYKWIDLDKFDFRE
jgi:hypothetical protein